MPESVLGGKRVLAVDDEPDILEVLEEELLESYPNCRFDKATSYEAATDLLMSHHYDLVILDIMGVRGFDLLALAVNRNFRVVMLTAHALNPDALKRSFEMKARAYLPKERLGEVVPFLEDVMKYDYLSGWKRLILRPNLFPRSWPQGSENWSWPLKVYTLGQFRLVREEEPVRFSGKVQRRPLLLLKVLITLGGKEMSEEQITDFLWPDSEGDAAHSAFTTTLSRLRRLLGIRDAIRFQDGKATLDPLHCWVDAWSLEEILDYTDAYWKEIRAGDDWSEVESLTEKAMGLYRGWFLPGDEAYPWTISCRERLRSKFMRLVTKIGESLEQTGKWARAAEYFQRVLEVEEVPEEFYRHLMVCYQQLGDRAEAIRVYQRCRSILSAKMGILPSPQTEAIYKNLVDRKIKV
jgi:two-component SAPR family response regulator